MQETNKLTKKKITMLLIAPLVFTPILCLMFNILFAQDASKVEEANKKKGFNFSLPQVATSDSGLNKLEADKFETEEKLKESAVDYSTEALSQSNSSGGSSIDNLIASVDKKNANFTTSNTTPTNQELSQLSEKYSSLYAGKSQGSNSLTPNDIPPPAPVAAPKSYSAPSYDQPRPAYRSGGGGGSGASEKKVMTRDFNNATADDGSGGRGFNQSGGNGEMLEAVVYGDQKVLSNQGLIKFRLLAPLKFQDIELPANSPIWGYADGGISTNRLAASIKSFKFNGRVYSVNWDIFDVDGNKGINVPGSGLKAKQNMQQGGSETIGEVEQGVNRSLGSNTDLKSAGIASGVRVVSGLVRRKNTNKIQSININLDNDYRIFINTKSN
jgi:Conjugative transposon, TraM